jgi:hypothetical protein
MKIISKRIAAVLIAVFCITYLAGCQINKVDTNPEVPINQEEKEVKEVKEDETPTTGNTKLKELAIQYEGNSLQISGDANEEILQDLFDVAEEKKTHTYTAADNMDPHIGKTTNEYRFPGMIIKTINTLEDKNKFYVYQMEVSDPKYTTPRLIKVGDSLDKLKEKYPEASLVPDSDYYLYSPVDHFDVMGFTIVDNKISKIKIYTLLE